jgi:hypothetical protein
MKQKLFFPFVPEFSAVFSAPPKFSGGVTEKVFAHRLGANLRPLDYEPDILPLRHCILVDILLWHSLCSLLGFSGRFCSYWQPDFPAVSVVTCRDFLAVSAVTGSRIFRPYL